jgi:hypothetical protein
MKRVWGVALAVLALWGGPSALRAQGAEAGREPKSVLDSVYTLDQASEGKALFDQLCLRCHAAPDFASARFHEKWDERTLRDLYALVSRNMPFDQPGSLRPQQTVEVLAFLLSVNGYPAGSSELTWDPEKLSAIEIDPPPKKVP